MSESFLLIFLICFVSSAIITTLLLKCKELKKELRDTKTKIRDMKHVFNDQQEYLSLTRKRYTPKLSKAGDRNLNVYLKSIKNTKNSFPPKREDLIL